jgi:hypothetical protein
VFKWNDSSLNRVLKWEEGLTPWSVKLLFFIVIYHYVDYNLFLRFFRPITLPDEKKKKKSQQERRCMKGGEFRSFSTIWRLPRHSFKKKKNSVRFHDGSQWVFVDWLFVDPSWCPRQVLIRSGSFRSFEAASGYLHRVSSGSVVFIGDVQPLMVVFMVVSSFCGIFCQLLSCPATFLAICGVLRRDLVVPAYFQ